MFVPAIHRPHTLARATGSARNQAMMDEQMFGVKPVEDGIVALARRNFRFWNQL